MRLKSSLVLRDFKVRSEENISAKAPFLRINTDKPKKPTYINNIVPTTPSLLEWTKSSFIFPRVSNQGPSVCLYMGVQVYVYLYVQSVLRVIR